MSKQLCIFITFFGLICSGCQPNPNGGSSPAGFKDSAVEHLSSEIENWMSGRDSEAKTIDVDLAGYDRPISFEIKSVVDEKPSPLALKDDNKMPSDWKSWPAYRVNVAYEFQSVSGGSVEKIIIYKMTFNTSENRWYVR